jgi:RND family efflux transporter MFP subunit
VKKVDQFMSNTSSTSLDRLQIAADKKTRRNTGPFGLALLILLVVAGAVAVFFATRKGDRTPIPARDKNAALAVTTPTPATKPTEKAGDAVLTVSGYIIPRERIEISPKFMGTVKWIGVKKGDRVAKDDIIVRLEDDEYRAQVLTAEGRLAAAEANLTNAVLNLNRQLQLAKDNVDSQRAVDDARRARDAAAAEITVAKGQLALAGTYLGWCTIRAPITGTILEKLVDPNELVTPQSFGGSRGPSTAFVAMADLNDLQVEIDVNEADLSKIALKQRCRIIPEAFTGKQYSGFVAEIAPEANRSKGTLQVKVQIEKPDQFLTPELTARVEFLKE